MSTASPLFLSSQNVTLPSLPELFDPNFLDVLLPRGDSEETLKKQAPNSLNTTASDSRTVTTNGAAALESTGSATLDAFNGLNVRSPSKFETILRDAWAEDPGLTLRIIWNMRSIHDGKGDKELFYGYVSFTLHLV